MSSDDQFTALGGGTPGTIGFQTDSTSIDVGADIYGNNSGIRGKSGRGLGVFGLNTFADSVGIGGIGARIGVLGSTDVSITDTNVAEGALVANNPLMSPDRPETAGIVGTVDSPYVSGQQPAAGVYGYGRDGDGLRGWGARRGVVGESREGEGIQGFSLHSRAGYFESGGDREPLVGQVQLPPQSMQIEKPDKPYQPSAFPPEGLALPADGRLGDLLMTSTYTPDGGDTCTLWVCVNRAGRAAIWRQVLLGPEVPGRAG